ARPLADLLWTRETASGVFDTPERRAALERDLRELTRRIADEEARRHYQQALRERDQAFFGNVATGRPPRRRQGIEPGSGRLAVSESLARSGLVQGAAGAMPARECAILVALVNHPRLLDEFFDQIETLEFSHRDL